MKNMYSYFNIAELISKQKLGELSKGEEAMLNDWLMEDPANQKVYEELMVDEILAKELNQLHTYNTQDAFDKISISLGLKIRQKIKFIPKLYKYAAAIVLFIIASYSIIGLLSPKRDQNADESIMPGTQIAILTTADNKTIELGREKKRVFRFKKTMAIDSNSILTYEIHKKEPIFTEKVEYNQLETPRGGEYTLVLSDGTKVQLNAETKLRYPVTFSENKREVFLEGEAYFDVTKSSSMPFIVATESIRVTVYGTSFNILAYSNEEVIQTTLVEGKIGIKTITSEKENELMLTPGQQANYQKKTHEITKKDVDINTYTAWIKGMFVFNNEPLEKILNKLVRWYDFEVIYSDEKIKYDAFTGDLKKYDDVKKIFDMISIASDLEFKIENKKVLVQRI